MNYRGQATNRWKMSALVIGLLALVLVSFGAYAPGDAAAADIAILADDPVLMGNHMGSNRNYGTWAGAWTAYLDQVATVDSNLIELDRNYGTWAGVWTDYLDQAATADPNLMELDRNYGTWAGVWTDYLDQAATQLGQAQ